MTGVGAGAAAGALIEPLQQPEAEAQQSLGQPHEGSQAQLGSQQPLPQQSLGQPQLGSQQLSQQLFFLQPPNNLSSRQLFFELQQVPQSLGQPQLGSQQPFEQQSLGQPQLGSQQLFEQQSLGQPQLGSQQSQQSFFLQPLNSLLSRPPFFELQQEPQSLGQPHEGSQQPFEQQSLGQPQLGSQQLFEQQSLGQPQLGSQQSLQPLFLQPPNSLLSSPPFFEPQQEPQSLGQPHEGSQQQSLAQQSLGQPQLGSQQSPQPLLLQPPNNLLSKPPFFEPQQEPQSLGQPHEGSQQSLAQQSLGQPQQGSQQLDFLHPSSRPPLAGPTRQALIISAANTFNFISRLLLSTASRFQSTTCRLPLTRDAAPREHAATTTGRSPRASAAA
ncbi:hypothetical protein Pla175_03660 [Pirellulimonas nuda]|uniref:Uncharacterized protein n=1 Tax=Pirellulimonas nuda TaxID=2528009 RepID=A0A518D6A5_9BACT|nr:hypothetical protein [Pirellulimonas nuda]QDU87012.1 hypothetical protein Pla175_03660 [Pirellulimonas nuda]